MFGDDHAEKTVVLDIGPDFGGQVTVFLSDVPVIDHLAQGVGGAVEKGAFFRAESGRRRLQ